MFDTSKSSPLATNAGLDGKDVGRPGAARWYCNACGELPGGCACNRDFSYGNGGDYRLGEILRDSDVAG